VDRLPRGLRDPDAVVGDGEPAAVVERIDGHGDVVSAVFHRVADEVLGEPPEPTPVRGDAGVRLPGERRVGRRDGRPAPLERLPQPDPDRSG
jgi:hypothetical protein